MYNMVQPRVSAASLPFPCPSPGRRCDPISRRRPLSPQRERERRVSVVDYSPRAKGSVDSLLRGGKGEGAAGEGRGGTAVGRRERGRERPPARCRSRRQRPTATLTRFLLGYTLHAAPQYTPWTLSPSVHPCPPLQRSNPRQLRPTGTPESRQGGRSRSPTVQATLPSLTPRDSAHNQHLLTPAEQQRFIVVVKAPRPSQFDEEVKYWSSIVTSASSLP